MAPLPLNGLDGAPGVVPVPGVVVLVPTPEEVLDVEPAAPIPLREITANSILPDVGFTMASSIWPIWLPEDPLTFAPINSLARTDFCELSPVELSCDWLEELPLLLPCE